MISESSEGLGVEIKLFSVGDITGIGRKCGYLCLSTPVPIIEPMHPNALHPNANSILKNSMEQENKVEKGINPSFLFVGKENEAHYRMKYRDKEEPMTSVTVELRSKAFPNWKKVTWNHGSKGKKLSSNTRRR